MQSFHKAVKLLGGADLGVEGVVIDDIVSVHAARTRFQARRYVAVTDAERSEVGNYRRSSSESEVVVELQAIGCARDVRMCRHDSRNHTTDQAGNIPCCSASRLTCLLA